MLHWMIKCLTKNLLIIKKKKMNKQVIEIEVPDGKRAVWDGNKIVFVPKDDWREIKTIQDAICYIEDNLPECRHLITEYRKAADGDYNEKVAAYRIVVAALTRNEKRHLTTGEVWFPVVQFCRPKDKDNCWGNVVVGTIKSEGEKYLVVGGDANYGAYAGLGLFNSHLGVSHSYTYFGFRSVSSKEVAEHISKYFGKLLFEVHYGGTNCDWKWVD